MVTPRKSLPACLPLLLRLRNCYSTWPLPSHCGAQRRLCRPTLREARSAASVAHFLPFACCPQTAITAGRKSLAERAAAAEAAADAFAQEQGLSAWTARRDAARRRQEQLAEALAVKQAELQGYKAEWQQRCRELHREKAAAARLTAELAGAQLVGQTAERTLHAYSSKASTALPLGLPGRQLGHMSRQRVMPVSLRCRNGTGLPLPFGNPSGWPPCSGGHA